MDEIERQFRNETGTIQPEGNDVQGVLKYCREYINWLKSKIKNLGDANVESRTGCRRSDKGFIFQIELSDDEIDKRFLMERKQILFDKEEHGDRYRITPSQEILLKMTDKLLSQMGTD